MPDKSDIYFVVAMATAWWFAYREGIKHRLRQWRSERRKRRGKHWKR